VSDVEEPSITDTLEIPVEDSVAAVVSAGMVPSREAGTSSPTTRSTSS